MNGLQGLVGSSAAIAAVRAQVERLLERQAGGGGRLPPILILGETGVGKGLLVRALHQASGRREGPLVEVNCAAIPDTLVEAELFGVERGAFTDARQAKAGLFQSANRGVLFLDEIGTLPLGTQAKLLTALEQRAVRRVGSTRNEAVDVWIVSATNQDLPAAMAEGRFRSDLYHRISPMTVRLPPLRDRPDDVLELAEHFLARACHEYGLAPRVLSADARDALCAHAWPGNVRELANLMERVALLSDGTDIAVEALELLPGSGQRREARPATRDSEREVVLEALEATDWNLSRAAARLGLPRNTLRYRIERFGLRRKSAPLSAGPPALADTSAKGPITSMPASSLRWERRWIALLRTVLSVPGDVSGYQVTSMLETLAQKAVSFGAVLDDLHPLGFTALFGLEPMEDAAHRALLVSQALHRAVSRAPEVSLLKARSAMHVAECLIARGAAVPGMDAGDRRRASETLDALLLGAPAGDTVVSGEGGRFVERAFDLEAIDGSAGGVVYRVVQRAPTSLAVAGRGRSTFVGRDRDLTQLDDLFARVEGGRGQVVGVVGDAGVGKSRLLYEFCSGIGAEQVTMLAGRCVAYGNTTPYLPIADLIREAFGFADTDGPEQIEGRLRAGVTALGLQADAVAPFILHMLGGAATRAAASRALSPEAMRTRTMEALKQVAVAASQRRPLVLVIEDLQWIDPTSEESVRILADSVAACRILLLVSYRQGYQPPWLGKSFATQLVLRRLGRSDSASIVEGAGKALGLPEAVTSEIVARADGNPFFLEELARTVTPGGQAGSAAAAIPSTIQGALEARLDRLAPSERSVIEAAAVLGKDGSIPLLREVAALPDAEFSRSLDGLRAHEFLHETAVVPTPQYTFEHVLTQEVAYRGLALGRRHALHAAAASAIERLAPEAADRRPELLALHYTEADRPATAIAHWLRAGQQAVQRSANVEAIAHLTRGLALLDALPDCSARLQQELALQLTLGTALASHHGYASDEIGRTLERIRVLAETLGEVPQLVPVRFGLWRFYISRAEFVSAGAFADSLLGVGERTQDGPILVAAHVASGITKFYLGELRAARAHLEQALDRQQPTYGRAQEVAYGQDLGVGATGYLGWVLTLTGELDTGLDAAERAVVLARESGHPFTLALGLLTAALVGADRREPERARRHGEALLELSREQRFGFFESLGLGLAGWADFALGQRARGLARMQEGVSRYHAAGQRVGLRNRVQLAEALIEEGRVDEGLAAIERDLVHVEATGEGALASEVYRIKAEALALRAPGNPETARLLERALTTASMQGADLLALRATMSWLRLAAPGPAATAARDELRKILVRFREDLDLPELRAARILLDGRRA